jgi:UDP-N-acetylmuramoyl-tripeptide--D-alanyl-D-alanine ligase
VLAAVCIGIYFGVSPAEIKKAVENYVPENNRSQIIQTRTNKLLLDAYNANPDSMKAALTDFFSMPGENKSVILGDMFELGPYAAEEHQRSLNCLRNMIAVMQYWSAGNFAALPKPAITADLKIPTD